MLLNARSLANKTFLLNDFMSHMLDFMFLTETWLCSGESVTCLNLFLLAANISVPPTLVAEEDIWRPLSNPSLPVGRFNRIFTAALSFS